jgi:hypothetical protein
VPPPLKPIQRNPMLEPKGKVLLLGDYNDPKANELLFALEGARFDPVLVKTKKSDSQDTQSISSLYPDFESLIYYLKNKNEIRAIIILNHKNPFINNILQEVAQGNEKTQVFGLFDSYTYDYDKMGHSLSLTKLFFPNVFTANQFLNGIHATFGESVTADMVGRISLGWPHGLYGAVLGALPTEEEKSDYALHVDSVNTAFTAIGLKEYFLSLKKSCKICLVHDKSITIPDSLRKIWQDKAPPEQFSISEMSETIYNKTTYYVQLYYPKAENREFIQALRFGCLPFARQSHVNLSIMSGGKDLLWECMTDIPRITNKNKTILEEKTKALLDEHLEGTNSITQLISDILQSINN